MHNYPSDVSREQFEVIRADLENARKKTRPRKTDLYDIFCAVLYVVKGGIQWTDESGVSLLDRVLKKISQNRP